ncbi:helix-turn-helix domain-containing protein [Streptomyces fractus]|uniref:helix-turn-helix domain-containing protein n=1 Tax=Streptomyces fractus TaxID=641806 RepID=UPI003CFA9B4B
MTILPTSGQLHALTAKLQYLLQLRRTPDGYLPSVREIAASAVPDGATKPSLSHSQINHLLNGRNTNPTLSSLLAVAKAFDVPAAYLLPGWDDLAALKALHANARIRTLVRLADGLDADDLQEVLGLVTSIRQREGLPTDLPETPTPPTGVDQSRYGRPNRRYPPAQAAERAAEDLQGP